MSQIFQRWEGTVVVFLGFLDFFFGWLVCCWIFSAFSTTSGCRRQLTELAWIIASGGVA